MPSSARPGRRRGARPATGARVATTAAAALAAAALLLTGCSATASASHEGTSGTITVDTLYGKVKVPAGAKRIVALDFPEATALADLGVKPVGVDNYIPDFPAYNTFFHDVPVVTDDTGNPDVEKVAAAKPDLIIGDMFASDVDKNRQLYQKLTAIAPTVMLEWTTAAGNWPADAAGTAKAIGKAAELDELKQSYEKHAEQIRADYAKELAATTVDLVSGNGTAWYLYSPDSSHGKVLAAAGARFAAAKTQKDGYVEYSPEKYGILQDTGLVVVDAANGAEAKPITSNPVFASLPAAKAGNVVTTPYFFPSSYRIADALLDDFADALKHLR